MQTTELKALTPARAQNTMSGLNLVGIQPFSTEAGQFNLGITTTENTVFLACRARSERSIMCNNALWQRLLAHTKCGGILCQLSSD